METYTNGNFKELLKEVKKLSHSKVEQGKLFEKMVKFYLQNDPLYAGRFNEIYSWVEWQEKNNKDERDVGIDLVAVSEQEQEIWAIQAKFYNENTSINKADVDTFFTASGKIGFTNRLFVSTTEKWGVHAEKALEDQTIPCTRIGLNELENSTIEWEESSVFLETEVSYSKISGNKKTPHLHKKITLPYQKTPYKHQVEAIDDVCEGLATADRGKLIMACGTGKTFTSLKIAEKIAPSDGYILFLVPSLSLLSQTLREWTAESVIPLRNFAVCSDAKVGHNDEDIHAYDLAIPVTTDPEILANKLKTPFEKGAERLNVVFSTYQSLDVVAQAQKRGSPEFDLVICDEAHRTTGVEKTNNKNETSYFTKIHDNDYIKAKKRLYMTATPRIYSDSSKDEAKDIEYSVYSMDDEQSYGKELHHLGFAKAIDRGLLSDYKVVVLSIPETIIAAKPQLVSHDTNNELDVGFVGKLIGSWCGLAKRILPTEQENSNKNNETTEQTEQTTQTKNTEQIEAIEQAEKTTQIEASESPMKRAVAFTSSIRHSKLIANNLQAVIEEFTEGEPLPLCEVKHIDGTMNALKRNKDINWLKEDFPENECRILSNARCLSEGVDVPALDAIIFFEPRTSQIDIVQATGRVMRKVEGKQYGYIIIPIIIPSNVEPEEALDDNKTYKTVWQILQALRAHDERFDAMVNSLHLQNNNSKNSLRDKIIHASIDENDPNTQRKHNQLLSAIEANTEWYKEIYSRIVKKCGSRIYWAQWAEDVGRIAQTNIERIKAIIKQGNVEQRGLFDEFLETLQTNINPATTEEDAIEMLSQHLITRPIFNALFENYDFTDKNPVSQSMQAILELLDESGLQSEIKKLERFYESISRRVSEIKDLQGKQKILSELYEKFFATAFDKVSQRLGIVYTPPEVVDFILHSADEVLHKEFNKRLTDENVNILDPFTGTGTFITRLLNLNLIKAQDLQRKYEKELYANEIVLLAYYIAAVNIEQSYHYITEQQQYQSFNGITLTDTFQINEIDKSLDDNLFPGNTERVTEQKNKKITVIIGNPPYSAGQKSGNDNNANLKYTKLDSTIRSTYAQDSPVNNKNSLYDSYIRAIRWATDRIDEEGVIAFVTNGSFIDSNVGAGIRKHLLRDFSAVYCLNLRGNIRAFNRKEGGNIFGNKSMLPVAITILIKKKNHSGKGKLYYHDIGDFLSQKQKLETIEQHKHYRKYSMENYYS